MSYVEDERGTRKQVGLKQYGGKDSSPLPGSELWTEGLICAFEFVRSRKYMSSSRSDLSTQLLPQKGHENKTPILEPFDSSVEIFDDKAFLDEIPALEHQKLNGKFPPKLSDSHWIPIGWSRIEELVKTVKVDGNWVSQPISFGDEEDGVTVADLATPYWQRAGGPTWWCHVDPTHQFVDSWLSSAAWLHPAIRIALKDESRLISERMKHLLYEVIFYL